jgi:choline dehydrogenase-like flavoprotein
VNDDERSGGWTDAELATLTALAETFVRGDGERRGRLAGEALDLVADPAQLGQLHLVLRAMGSRTANLLLAARPAGFAAMSPEARERYLLGWANSRIPQRRSAFHAFRKLLTFLAYADPGDQVPDPHLATVGYRPDDPPVTADLCAIEPHVLPAATAGPGPGDGAVTLDADAVIVGSGAGGGVVAAALSAAGRSVVVLEAGPFVNEASMPRKEVDAFDRLYLDHGLLTTWDGSVTLLAGTGVGGGTLINWMTCIPATGSVRAEWEADHGLEGVTGEPWTSDVAAIETELDVAEATHIPPKDAIILRGARALGWEAAPTRRNASACGDCGSCPFGCRRGTKRSGIRAHLATAFAAGARIVPNAHVTKLLTKGGRAIGVEAEVIDGPATRRLTVRAPTVVLAAGGLRSPAILQRSGFDRPSIGRYLRVHPVPVVAGRFTERVEMWRGTMQAARSLEFSEPAAGRNGYVIESAPGHPGLLALALPWEGTDEHARLMARSSYLAPLIAVTRDGGEGRVSLTRAGRVRLDYRLDPLGVATMRHALVSMARLARAAGATEILAAGTPPAWYHPIAGKPAEDERAYARFEEDLVSTDLGPNRAAVFSAHQMGTVRMGADAATHPCDPWGRVRAGSTGDTVVGGLYVGDSSVFPTAIGVNPMITVMALARRLSRVILAET